MSRHTITEPPGTRIFSRGFTVIELLVVMAVIAILLALLRPAVQEAREAAQSVASRNNLKKIGQDLLSYHSRARDFPAGLTNSGPEHSTISAP